MISVAKIIIDGKEILLCTRKELLKIAVQEQKILVSLNANILMKVDARFNEIVNNNIGYADGIGAVWAVKRFYPKANIEKIPGVEFWLDILENMNNKKLYLIGGTQQVIEKVVQKCGLDFPDVKLVGFRNGFIKSDEERRELYNDIVFSKPDIVVIAMGQPIQEYLAQDLFALHRALYLCVGGSFDVYVGIKRRAPKLMINIGLEWLYRLIKEPKRLKRNLVCIPFIIKVIFKDFQCKKL